MECVFRIFNDIKEVIVKDFVMLGVKDYVWSVFFYSIYCVELD